MRLFIDVVADPGAKRNWRIDTIEMVVERKDGSAHERLLRDELFTEPDEFVSDAAGVGDAVGNAVRNSRHSRHSYLGEDDLASGAFRAVAGATFLTCESLLDDAAFDAFWLETLRAERELKEKARAPGATPSARREEREGARRGGGEAGRREGNARIDEKRERARHDP